MSTLAIVCAILCVAIQVDRSYLQSDKDKADLWALGLFIVALVFAIIDAIHAVHTW